jgi:hypothetical protein
LERRREKKPLPQQSEKAKDLVCSSSPLLFSTQSGLQTPMPFCSCLLLNTEREPSLAYSLELMCASQNRNQDKQSWIRILITCRRMNKQRYRKGRNLFDH